MGTDRKDGTSFFLSNFRKERVRSSKQKLISQRAAVEAQQWELADRTQKMVVCRGPEHDFKPFLYELRYQIRGIQYILEMGKNGIWRVTQSQCLPFDFTNVMACTRKIYRDTESGPCHRQGLGYLVLGGTDNQQWPETETRFLLSGFCLSPDAWPVLGYAADRLKEVSTWTWHTSSGHSTESGCFIWWSYWSFRG